MTRAKTLREPASFDEVFLAELRALFDAHWTGKPLRLVGVALGGFTGAPRQPDLLDPARDEKRERLARAADRLRDRYGFGKIRLGGSLPGDED